jgi:hypothetical protein
MSRTSIVVMLIAAEVLVVGMAMYALGGGGTMFAAGMHRVDFTAAPIAPIAVGAAPHVVLDDSASRIHVTVGSDEYVRVRDLTEMHGAIFSNQTYPQLRVRRTADGVRIERAAVGRLAVSIFGFSTEAIAVELPKGSRVEIAHCAGADVSGVTGGVSVASQDGHVKLTDLQGTVDAHSDDGYLEATDVRGDRLSLESMDGHVALKNVTAGSLLARTHDGRIEARNLSLTGARPEATLHTDDGSMRVSGSFAPSGAYEISSGDGSIQLRLARDADLAIDASTGSGRISVDGSALDGDDSVRRTLRLGSGTGTMRVATGDGSIHIYTNGVFQSDGL